MTRALEPDPSWRRLAHRWLVEYNPLYLLSAMLVLAGTMLVSRSFALEGSAAGILGVAAIAEAYAVALIGGAALLTRLGLRRPAVMLGLLTVLYQADLTLHTESCVHLGNAGIAGTVVWALLFVAKLAALAWALRLELSHRALLTASLGALGVALFPWLLASGPSHPASSLVAIWVFGLASLRPSATVASKLPLDGWAGTVLRRSVRAAWTLWGALLGLHLLFWAKELRLDLGMIAAAAPFLVVRRLRTERSVWLLTAASMVFVWISVPAAFATAAAVAALALVLRAHTGTAMPAASRVCPRPTGPYRVGGPLTTMTADRSDSFDPIELPVALSDGAAVRLEVGALFALFLAAHAAWPQKSGEVFVALVVLTLAFFVWRRSAFAFLPVALCGARFALVRHLVPVPETMLGWGTAALVLGFALLAVALAASSWITLRSRREVEHSMSPRTQ